MYKQGYQEFLPISLSAWEWNSCYKDVRQDYTITTVYVYLDYMNMVKHKSKSKVYEQDETENG